MIESALYHCTVTHKRQKGPAHALRYRIAYLLIDIDEAPAISRRLRLFGFDRSRPFSLKTRDHGQRDGGSLREWAEGQLDGAGLAEFGTHLYLLCMPRMLGYAFNPLSVWYCADDTGRIGAVIYEVHNTFGGRHAYTLPVESREDGAGFALQETDKEFYVSPFLGMAARYEFQLSAPGDALTLTIRHSDDAQEVLRASVHGKRAPLNDRALAGIFFRYPLMTLKVTLGIHWEAIRLWLKGARFQSRKWLSKVQREGRFGGSD